MVGIGTLRLVGATSSCRVEDDPIVMLIDEHWDLLYRSAYFICADRWIAEDIAQDATLKAITGLPGFDRSRPIEPWLSQIAANAARDWLRKRDRRAEVTIEGLELQPGEPDDLADSIAADAIPDELAGALLKLELPMRTTIVMRHLLDLTTSEIAALLEIEPATVRTRLHRGLNQLRSELEEEADA